MDDKVQVIYQTTRHNVVPGARSNLSLCAAFPFSFCFLTRHDSPTLALERMRVLCHMPKGKSTLFSLWTTDLYYMLVPSPRKVLASLPAANIALPISVCGFSGMYSSGASPLGYLTTPYVKLPSVLPSRQMVSVSFKKNICWLYVILLLGLEG